MQIGVEPIKPDISHAKTALLAVFVVRIAEHRAGLTHIDIVK